MRRFSYEATRKAYARFVHDRTKVVVWYDASDPSCKSYLVSFELPVCIQRIREIDGEIIRVIGKRRCWNSLWHCGHWGDTLDVSLYRLCDVRY